MPQSTGPAPHTTRHHWLRWAWIPLTLVVIAALAQIVDVDLVWHELRAADPWRVAGMLATWLLWLALRPVRMRMLLRATAPEVAVGYNDAFGAHALGNALNGLLPMRAGEFGMLWVLNRRAHVPVAGALSAVVLDRLCDLAAAVCLLGLATLALPNRPQVVTDGLMAVVVALAVGTLILALAIRLRRAALALAGRVLPARWHPAVLPRLEGLLVGLSVLARPAVLARAAVLSAAIWTVTATSFTLGIGAVWPDVGLMTGAFTVGVTAMAFLVPAAPGGVGIFHAAIVFALSFFSVPAEKALAFALLTHALTLVTGLTVAGLWTLLNGLDARRIARDSLAAAEGEDTPA
ncbi:MAG: flippase-like domain-containing protein [Rhodospirillales bacterium]|nr:flippase-like domain-containing protein [Rhodospirillales bacterium]